MDQEHNPERDFGKSFSNFATFPPRTSYLPPSPMDGHEGDVASDSYHDSILNDHAAAGQREHFISKMRKVNKIKELRRQAMGDEITEMARKIREENSRLKDENRVLKEENAMLKEEIRIFRRSVERQEEAVESGGAEEELGHNELERMERELEELKEMFHGTSLIFASVPVDAHIESAIIRSCASSLKELERQVEELKEEPGHLQNNIRVATEEFHSLVEMVDPEGMAEFRRRQSRTTEERVDDRCLEEIWRETVMAVKGAFAAKEVADTALENLWEKAAPYILAADPHARDLDSWLRQDEVHSESAQQHDDTEAESASRDSPVCTCVDPRITSRHPSEQYDYEHNTQASNRLRIYEILGFIEDVRHQIGLWTLNYPSQDDIIAPIVEGFDRLCIEWRDVIGSGIWRKEKDKEEGKGPQVGLRGGMDSTDELLLRLGDQFSSGYRGEKDPTVPFPVVPEHVFNHHIIWASIYAHIAHLIQQLPYPVQEWYREYLVKQISHLSEARLRLQETKDITDEDTTETILEWFRVLESIVVDGWLMYIFNPAAKETSADEEVRASQTSRDTEIICTCTDECLAEGGCRASPRKSAQDSDSDRGRRSGAPSPESPKKPKEDSAGVWRQLETEMAILQLQDRLAELEKRSESSGQHLPATLVDTDTRGSDRLGKVAKHVRFQAHDNSSCVCSNPGCTASSSCAGPQLRGVIDGRDEDEEYVYGDGEYMNWNHVDQEEVARQQTISEHKATQTEERTKPVIQELRQKIEELEEQVRNLGETTRAELDDFRRAYHTDRHSTYGSRKKGVQQPQEQNHRSDVTVNTDMDYSPVFTPLARGRLGHHIVIPVPQNFTIPSPCQGFPTIIFGDWQHTHVRHFPDGANDAQLRLYKGSFGQQAEDIYVSHMVSPGMEYKLKEALKMMLERTSGLDWEQVTRGLWSGVGKGDTYVVGRHDTQYLYDDRAKEEMVCMRGRSGGEVYTHVTESEDQTQGSAEPDLSAAEREEMRTIVKESSENERVFFYHENLVTTFLTTNGYGRGYKKYLGKRYEHRPTEGEPADDEGIGELRTQIERLKSELLERVCQFEPLNFDDDTAPIVRIELDPNVVIPSSNRRQYHSLAFGKHALDFHFPKGATAKQKLALQIPSFELGQDVDDGYIIHLGALHTKQELKNSVVEAEQNPNQENWKTLTQGRWPGVGTGDTYIICDQDAVLSSECIYHYGRGKAECPLYWCYNHICHFDYSFNSKINHDGSFDADKVAPEKPETMTQKEWDMLMKWETCSNEDCEECSRQQVQSVETDEEAMHIYGGNEEGKVEMDGDYEHGAESMRCFEEQQATAAQDISVLVSPHTLCHQVTSHIDNTTIDYLTRHLLLGFAFLLVNSGAPPTILEGAATIYHFPNGATPDSVQREAWKQKACGVGHWTDIKVMKIRTAELEHVLKEAISVIWETLNTNWESEALERWRDNEQGDTSILNDTHIGLAILAADAGIKYMRGGCDDGPTSTTYEPIQRRSSALQGHAEDFDRIYGDLLEETANACSCEALSDCIEAWMTFATILQTHNHSLEHESEEFKNMYYDLIHDIHWQIGTSVELEERAEIAEEVRDVIKEELEDLKIQWAHLVDFVTTNAENLLEHIEKETAVLEDRNSFSRPWTMRGGYEVPGSTASQGCNEAVDVQPKSGHICGATMATGFEFFPKRATIVFAGNPPPIYQFPHGTTLPEIRKILDAGSDSESRSSEPYCLRILEIMKVREDMGVRLPEILEDERVTIGIPYVPPGKQVNKGIAIAEWQTSDTNTNGLKALVTRLDINADPETTVKDTSHRASASSGEEDYYQDLGDLVNTLNSIIDHDTDTGSPKFCVCEVCKTKGRETYFDVQDLQRTPVVSVRGGGGDRNNYGTTGAWNLDSDGTRIFPLQCLRLTKETNAPSDTPEWYGTLTPGAFPAPVPLPIDHKIATSNEPLGLRLGCLMFPPKFVQEREHTIRGFSWRHTKQKNPQFKDKGSKRYKYRKGPECKDWEAQLDKHREHCDYCQSVFLEEEYGAKTFEPAEDIRHEDDAPMPNSGSGRPWESSARSDNTNTSPFPVVEDPDPLLRLDAETQDPQLRGGAGYEQDLEPYDEDWRPEWDDLASLAACSSCANRAFRNSSTLSTKTLVCSSSPFERKVRTLHRPETVDHRENGSWNEDDWISCRHFGKYAPSPHRYRPRKSDTLASPKTNRPWLAEMRKSRDGVVTGRLGARPISERYPTQPERLRSTALEESTNRLSALRVDDWLENPRSAPPPPLERKFSDLSEDAERPVYVREMSAWERSHSGFFSPLPTVQSSVQAQSFMTKQYVYLRSRRHAGPARDGLSTRSLTIREDWGMQERLVDGLHEQARGLSPVKGKVLSTPKPFPSLCQRCAELLAVLMQYVKSLLQRVKARKSTKTPKSRKKTPQYPAPTRSNTYSEGVYKKPSPLVSSLNTLKQRLRAKKPRSPSKSPKESPPCPAQTRSNSIFRDFYNQEPVRVSRLDKQAPPPNVYQTLISDMFAKPAARLNKSLPPTPQTSTSTDNLPLTSSSSSPSSSPSSSSPTINLPQYRSAVALLHPKSAALPTPFPPTSPQMSLFERASAMAQAIDDAQAEVVWRGIEEGHLPTVDGPSDLVKRAVRMLVWEERKTGEVMG